MAAVICKRFFHVTKTQRRFSSGFSASSISVQRTQNPKTPNFEGLLFGHTMTDHMLTIKYNIKTGWDSPRIGPVAPLDLHPASKVLHYASTIFEGCKAYKGVDNKIRLFRLEKNMERFQNSAKRACLPAFNEVELNKCIVELIKCESKWVPPCDPSNLPHSSTLYIRPTLFATEPTLGVSPSTDALLLVLLSPVGPYYPTGFKPVTLWACDSYNRAWPGGSGYTKMGSNYAPTLMPQKVAASKNCQQVLWLYNNMLTEVGTMNVFVHWINEAGQLEIVTPPLSPLILPGITRDSILNMLKRDEQFSKKIAIVEKDICLDEILQANSEGRLKEMFGAGTACIVSPISGILHSKGGEEKIHDIPTMSEGAPITNEVLTRLTGMQFGKPQEKDAKLAKEWTTVIA